MAVTTTFPFTTAGNYTYGSEAQVTGGVAKLSLEPGTGSYSEDFSSDTGHTYNSSLVSFIAGTAGQVDQRPAGATFGATYTSSVNGSWGSGTLTGTANNGATITGTKLDLTAGTTAHVEYTATGNADFTQTGTVKFKFTPNYTGNSAGNSRIFGIGEATGLVNQMYFYHSTTGRLYYIVYDSAGSPIINTFFDTWSATSGTTYEFELNLDFNSGDLRLFIDGVQKSSTKSGTGTRSATATKLIVGAAVNGTSGIDGSIEDFVVYNTVQHTTNYTPGYVLPENTYAESTVVPPEFSHTLAGSLTTVTALTTTEAGTVRYTVQLDQSGTYLYWTGSAWGTSDGTYAQSTSKADFNTNVAALDVSGDQYIQVRVHFQAGSSQHTISDLAIATTEDIGYYQTDPSILTVTPPIKATALASFSAVESVSGQDAIGYVVQVDSVDKYWDGSAWATSDGTYAQSNTAAVINTRLTSLISTPVIKSIAVKAFLHSDDGQSTPELNSVSLTYTPSLAYYPFTTAGNYTYNAAVSTVVSGLGQLLDLRAADTIFAATYSANDDGNYGDGVLTGTIDTGSPTVSAGYLDLTGAANARVDYDAVLNAPTSIGAVRFKYRPNYTGNPATVQVPFRCWNGANNANIIEMYHLAGNFVFKMSNAAGSPVVSISAAWSPTSGQDYEIELNWDGIAGSTKAFIDGVQHGAEDTTTFTRVNTSVEMMVGKATVAQDFSLGYLTCFDVVQHTAGYTAPIADPADDPYDTSDPDLLTNDSFTGSLRSFTAVDTAAGSDLVRYVLRNGSTDYYWDGAAWATSSGYAESNLATELTDEVCRAYDPDNNATQVRVYLHSDDGSTTPSVDEIQIVYTSSLGAPTEPFLVNLNGYIYDNRGPAALEKVQIRPYLQGYIDEGVHHIYEWRELDTTSSNGYFNGFTFTNASQAWEFRIGSQKYWAVIPQQSVVDWSTLTLNVVT